MSVGAGTPDMTYRRSVDQDRARPAEHPLVIVGAGPVGLALALDLERKGHRPVVIERRTTLADGSRAICWSKRTLEIMDRLGLAERLIRRGVTWRKGKVFHDTRLVYEFDLLPEPGHKCPAFINLQQYLFEAECVAAAEASGAVDLRFGHEVTAIAPRADGCRIDIATPDGPYAIEARYLVAADGARSSVRRALGLGFEGQVFDDQFLITDIRLALDRPTERWFWFDPPFNRGQSALLHRQADDVWRLDFQIGPDADREAEMRPENVAARVRAMLGDISFDFEWISVYRFQCRRVERFRRGPVLLVGDAAHQVSPFGARGGNSGIQDADNLAWKLDLVLRGLAPDRLLDSYDAERRQAADENITASTRSTDFISPKGPGATALRDGVLALAATQPFARRLLNSGRLSLPTTYDGSPLNSADGFGTREAPATRPGAPAIDAPLPGQRWLLEALGGSFAVVSMGSTLPMVARGSTPLRPASLVARWLTVKEPEALSRYGAEAAPAVYLIRPDQHIAARWRNCTEADIDTALARATANL